MTEQEFRWLQPFAVLVSGVEGLDPKAQRPVLAVQEHGAADPWRVQMVFVVPDDEGRFARVPMENCILGGVGSWSQLQLLSERARQIQAPQVRVPQNLRQV